MYKLSCVQQFNDAQHTHVLHKLREGECEWRNAQRAHPMYKGAEILKVQFVRSCWFRNDTSLCVPLSRMCVQRRRASAKYKNVQPPLIRRPWTKLEAWNPFSC